MAKLTPIKAIESLDELFAECTRRYSHMRNEASEIAELWEGLGYAGGQRDDHAAALLGRLRPHLSGLAAYMARVETQIDRMVKDPFDRNGD